jgi:hypothetical protein
VILNNGKNLASSIMKKISFRVNSSYFSLVLSVLVVCLIATQSVLCNPFLAEDNHHTSMEPLPWNYSVAPDSTHDTTIRKPRTRLLALPALFYLPKTKLGGGALSLMSFRTDTTFDVRPSTITLVGVYTQRKQTVIEIEPKIFFAKNKYFFTGDLTYLNFPDRLFGVGNTTADSTEENFTPRIFRVRLSFQQEFTPSFYAGLLYRMEHHEILESDSGGLVATNRILGANGGLQSGFGIYANWDSRTNIFFPADGIYYYFSAAAFGGFVGSDFGFSRIKMDMRNYFTLAEDHVLATRFYSEYLHGDVPFQQMARIGGDDQMRGYFEGRYRDNVLYSAQAEYRLVPFWWRIGATGFASLGGVASSLDKARLTDLHYTVGGGLRFIFDEDDKLTVRFDIGFTELGSNFYVTLREAF